MRHALASLSLSLLLVGGLAPAVALAEVADETTAVENAPVVETLASQASDEGRWGTLPGGGRAWYVDGEAVTSALFTDPETDLRYWAKGDGTIAESEECYDPATDAWYLASEDGSLAVDEEVYLEDGDKTVFYDEDGRMVKGEDYRLSPIDGKWHWRYFEPVTGALQKGFSYVREHDKWCYYEPVNGWMLYGEQYIDEGWYYFDPDTGAIDYEWAWIPNLDKWVYYDAVTGRMVHGQRMIDGRPYYFDQTTGRVLTAQELKDRLIATARSSYYTHPDCDAELAAAGGTVCPHGPCMAYVWWVFHHADLDVFLADGTLRSGWPHENLDWYRANGRADRNPAPGDIVFFRYPGFAYDKGLSASHVGIVVSVSGNTMRVADAAYSSIEERTYWVDGYLAGIAHPYWE